MDQQLIPPLGSGAMFDAVAHRYDVLNRLMSFGIDRRWRKRAARSLPLYPGARVLDLATGTGDLAIDIAARHPGAHIVGIDPSVRMLEVAREKLRERSLLDRIELEVGTAESLPFPDGSFDAVTMAFGIRNCADRAAALREMIRVLRPGGRVAILELGEPRSGLLAPAARFHIHRVVPRLGSWLSGQKEYRYLQESIAAFPPASEFAELMTQCGHEVLEVTAFAFGSCTLFLSTTSRSEERHAG